MNTTALLLSAALAFFNGAQDAAPKLAAPTKSDAFAAKAVQDAEPQPGPDQPAPAREPLRQAVEPDRERADQDAQQAADPLPAPAAVETSSARSMTQTSASRAAEWFDGVETLRARFMQTAPDGTVSEGEFSLQRPGRARFDYDDPSPILLVADGSTVAIADFELETIDRAPIRSTPMRFLLNGSDQLADAVTEAGRASGKLYITVVDPDGEVDGRLTLVFEDPDPDAPASQMLLTGWFAVDAMGGLTEVNLSDMERGASLDPRLFILDDEDVVADDRRSRRR
ncbi:MAG: LolA family protein [Oceanicaulis sp.]